MKRLGLSEQAPVVPAFQTYYDLLTEKNKVMDLTAISGEKDVCTLHFLDSLALLTVEDMHDCNVIDIGSGAGFPGFPLTIARPSVRLTALDAQRKRVDFLTELARALGRPDIRCIHARAEEAALTELRESFDYALSRAVARLSMLCELCMPFVRPGGAFIAMKSVDTEEEINQAKTAVKTLGGRIETVADYTIPETDVVHRAVVIRKIGPTPKGYPRRFAKIKSNPL